MRTLAFMCLLLSAASAFANDEAMFVRVGIQHEQGGICPDSLILSSKSIESGSFLVEPGGPLQGYKVVPNFAKSDSTYSRYTVYGNMGGWLVALKIKDFNRGFVTLTIMQEDANGNVNPTMAAACIGGEYQGKGHAN